MDKGCLNGVIFLDLKKASDGLNHNILTTKMDYYEIRGRDIAGFESSLTNRIQI